MSNVFIDGYRPSAPSRGQALDRRAALDGLRGLLAGDLPESLVEPAGVGLLRLCQRLEPLRELREALVARGLRHARVHLRVLVGLARDRGLQIFLGLADRLARRRIADLFEIVEVSEGMARLRIRGVLEKPRDVREAFDIRDAREVEVAAIRLRLARERLLQVVQALAPFQALTCHDVPLVWWMVPRARGSARSGRRAPCGGPGSRSPGAPSRASAPSATRGAARRRRARTPRT